MTVNKITDAPTQNELIDKVNEVIDNISGGSITDVQINGTSVTSGGVADIITNTAYNSSTNKIATMSDVPTDTSDLTNGAGYTTNVGTVTKVNNTSPDSNGNVTIQIPDDTSDLTNGAGFITGITGKDVKNALGYTPYNGTTNPNGYQENVIETIKVNDTARIVTNKTVNLYIPNAPNSGTLTIQKNGTAVKTFSADSANDVTCNITVPTKESDLTPDRDYATNTALTNGLAGKQETLVSGTNIKTFNGNSLLGSGNISIPTTTVDDALSTTSENPVQNKLITNELNNKANYSGNSIVETNQSYVAVVDTTNKAIKRYAISKIRSGLATSTELTNGLASKQDTISDLSTIRSGASAGATAVQPNDLATVATSGSYNDLADKPTIDYVAYTASEVETLWSSI